jgi:hypothetical protein
LKIKKTEEDKYSHLAPLSEVETNDNLNIPRYVDMFEEEEAIDLKAITIELLAVLAIRQMLPSKICTELGNRNFNDEQYNITNRKVGYVLVPSKKVSGVIGEWEEKNQSTLEKTGSGKDFKPS